MLGTRGLELLGVVGSTINHLSHSFHWLVGMLKEDVFWDLWEEHKEFVAKELENAAESAAADGQGPKEEKPVEETSNYSSAAPATGTLADSDQLAALRDQLLGK